MRKFYKFAGIVLGVLILIQFIPYGRDHANPPVVQEPAWNNQNTRVWVKQACFDCHSNETTWPWYSNIAPISWLVQYDVEVGRNVMNFSEWGEMVKSKRYLQQLGDSVEMVILSNAMPPYNYLLLHPEGVLSQGERDQMITGLKNIFEQAK
jgi:hypothetical protein